MAASALVGDDDCLATDAEGSTTWIDAHATAGPPGD